MMFHWNLHLIHEGQLVELTYLCLKKKKDFIYIGKSFESCRRGSLIWTIQPYQEQLDTELKKFKSVLDDMKLKRYWDVK